MSIFIKENPILLSRIEETKNYLNSISYFSSEENHEKFNIFIKRMSAHIEKVRSNAKIIQDQIKFPENLYNFTENHDELKFLNPELIPYIDLTMENLKKEISPNYVRNINASPSILHHVINSSHHPEFYHPTKDSLKELGVEKINALSMPDFFIAEMICDWKAMSQELNTNIYVWIKTNVGKRWLFSEKQQELIMQYAKLLDNV